MPRGLRKKTKQYVLDRFQEEDPEEYFKYKVKSAHGLSHDQLELLQAVESWSVVKVKSLLNRGVDPNFLTTRNRQTPLHLAVENRPGSEVAQEKIVGVLLFFGADPNALDYEGRSPLHTACMAGNTGITELLLQAGADVNAVDNNHETPVMAMCSCLSAESLRILELLLEAGADITYTNKMDQSALHLVIISRCSSSPVFAVRHCVADVLLRHGLCANTPDGTGTTPLCQELFTMPMRMYGWSNAEDLTQLARTLVRGGAMLQDYEFEIFFTRMVNINVAAVTAFLRDLCHVMPRAQLMNYLMTICSVGHRSIDIQHLEQLLMASLTNVSSLAQECKICLRSALSGRVLSDTQCLPLPVKIKEFIQSVE